MPRVYDHEEPDDYYEGDAEGDGDWHYDFDDSLPTILCPYCQEEIPEDTPKCPYCGDYISKEDHVEKPFPNWIKFTALILVLLMGFGYLFTL